MDEINCSVPLKTSLSVTDFNSAAHVKVELRKEFQAQEAALQRSLSKLRSELQKAQEEARENRDKTNRLQTSLANAEGTIKVCALVCVRAGDENRHTSGFDWASRGQIFNIFSGSDFTTSGFYKSKCIRAETVFKNITLQIVLVITYSFSVSLELAQTAGGGHPGWRDLGDATEGHWVWTRGQQGACSAAGHRNSPQSQ